LGGGGANQLWDPLHVAERIGINPEDGP